MKDAITIIITVIIATTSVFGQEKSASLDNPLGLRIKKNGQDYLIYADEKLAPNFDDYRKLNFQVYFRVVDFPTKDINGKTYQLISIPGSSNKLNQNNNKLVGITPDYPRAGKTVSKEDYDSNFWIEVENIEKNTEVEYYKYANSVFSGFLTAPFKYRLKEGNAPEALIDGDFNVAPFIGWKWRVSSAKPYYVAPFGFAGVTTLNYNSANNTEITEAEKLENGTGLTYGLGLSFRFGDISPGFVIGWDKGFGNIGKGFLYNDKPWISFSVNYDLFKPSKTSTGSQK